MKDNATPIKEINTLNYNNIKEKHYAHLSKKILLLVDKTHTKRKSLLVKGSLGQFNKQATHCDLGSLCSLLS
jgi:hypothetical protein